MRGLTPVAAWTLRNALRYRRPVVHDNLNAPGLQGAPSEASVYRNLASILLETVLGAGMAQATLARRVQFAEVQTLGAEGPLLLTLGHVANWEWLLQVARAKIGRPVEAVVRPPSLAAVDRTLSRLRTRFGARQCPETQFVARLRAATEGSESVVFAILADQWPAGAHVTVPFRGRPTRWSTAFATLARRYRVPVVYGDVRRLGVSRYAVRFERLSDPPHASTEALVAAYVSRLEQTVARDPASWLWTHRRWKVS